MDFSYRFKKLIDTQKIWCRYRRCGSFCAFWSFPKSIMVIPQVNQQTLLKRTHDFSMETRGWICVTVPDVYTSWWWPVSWDPDEELSTCTSKNWVLVGHMSSGVKSLSNWLLTLCNSACRNSKVISSCMELGQNNENKMRSGRSTLHPAYLQCCSWLWRLCTLEIDFLIVLFLKGTSVHYCCPPVIHIFLKDHLKNPWQL